MSYRDLVKFLIKGDVIRTYWHIEAVLCLREEGDDPERYVASFSGRHLYYTSQENEDQYGFAVEIDKQSGEIVVIGALNPD